MKIGRLNYTFQRYRVLDFARISIFMITNKIFILKIVLDLEHH